MTRPILFLHPFGLDGHAAQWVARSGMLTPTLPNHGARRLQRPGLTIEDMVDELVGWLGEPADVIGCSIGGMLALHLALDHPDKVASLALVCTAASVPRDAILARARETLEWPPDRVLESTLERWFMPATLQTKPTVQLEYAVRQLRGSDPVGLAAVWNAVAEHDVRSRLHEIEMPTSCIAGTHDVSAPPSASRELAASIKGARLETIDAGHMAFLEKPQRFSALLDEHLTWARA